MWECIECGAELTTAQFGSSPSTSCNDVFCSIECRDRRDVEQLISDGIPLVAFVATPLSPVLAELAEAMHASLGVSQ